MRTYTVRWTSVCPECEGAREVQNPRFVEFWEEVQRRKAARPDLKEWQVWDEIEADPEWGRPPRDHYPCDGCEGTGAISGTCSLEEAEPFQELLARIEKLERRTSRLADEVGYYH